MLFTKRDITIRAYVYPGTVLLKISSIKRPEYVEFMSRAKFERFKDKLLNRGFYCDKEDLKLLEQYSGLPTSHQNVIQLALNI